MSGGWDVVVGRELAGGLRPRSARRQSMMMKFSLFDLVHLMRLNRSALAPAGLQLGKWGLPTALSACVSKKKENIRNV